MAEKIGATANPLPALVSSGRAGEIRTRDLLNPIQAFYQAELRPDLQGGESSYGIACWQACFESILASRKKYVSADVKEMHRAMP